MKTNISNHLGDLDAAAVWGARALEIAERGGDLRLRLGTTTMLEQTHFMRGEYERVINLAKANLTALPAEVFYYERVGVTTPTSVYDRGWLVRSLAELGRFTEAIEPAEAAIAIAERTKHPYSIGWACYCAGALHMWAGRWSTARTLYQRGIDAFREGGGATTLGNAISLSAWILTCLGDTVEALKRAHEGEDLLAVAREQWRIAGASWSYVWLGHGYLRLGRPDDAERVLHRVLEPRTASTEAYTWHLQGDIAAAHPDRSNAVTSEECYRRALSRANALGMRPLVAHCHFGLAKLYGRTGKRREADEQRSVATTMYRAMDMRFWLAEAEADLPEPA